MRRRIDARPAVDLGGSCFAVAIKKGGSETLHIDASDHVKKYAVITTVGKFTGGEFCVPHFGWKIPVGPGQILLVPARLLAHCTAPFAGDRIVITGFTHELLGTHSGEDNQIFV
jgi:hypothetical protein